MARPADQEGSSQRMHVDIDSHEDIASTFDLVQMRISAPGRKKFQRVHVWAAPDLEGIGSNKGEATNKLFMPHEIKIGDAVGHRTHPRHKNHGGKLPAGLELKPGKGTKEYVEVGFVVGSHLDKYSVTGSPIKKRPKGPVTTHERHEDAMRVFAMVTEKVESISRLFVGVCEPPKKEIRVRTVMSNIKKEVALNKAPESDVTAMDVDIDIDMQDAWESSLEEEGEDTDDISNAKNEIDTLRARLDSTNEDVAALMIRNDDLEQSLSNVTAERDQLMFELDQVVVKYDQGIVESETLQWLLQPLEAEKDQSDQQSRERDQEIREQSQQIQDRDQQIQQLQKAAVKGTEKDADSITPWWLTESHVG